MTDTIEICLRKCRQRQYELTIGEYSYGEWMSKSTPRMIADHVEDVLNGLKESGIIPEHVKIVRVDKLDD